MAEPQPQPEAPQLAAVTRWGLVALAWTSLALGIIGIFLPLLPTTPFVLLAAWAAAKSSPRLSRWLENHPRFGPALRDWRHSGVVGRRSKWQATAVMTASAVIILVVVKNPWAAGAALACMAAVLCWLWLRPEQGPR